MSVISLDVSATNPVKREHLDEALRLINPKVSLTLPEKDVADHLAILSGSHEAFQKIIDLPDYVPTVDKVRFPRKNVQVPGVDVNESNAWAWLADVTDVDPKGALKGVTVVLKDNIALADVPCSIGTSYIKDWKPIVDATVVTRVLEAGATIKGKAVCENLSYYGASISAATGSMHNPYAPGYSAGGSSSGCAVLVARGEVDMAIGGDQGGSIRLPAAQCGIVGFKPTHGLIPYTGICLLERTVDTTGPMTKDIMDNAKLLQVLAGADNIDDRQLAGCPLPHQVPDYPAIAAGGIKGLRIGIVSESLSHDLTDPRYAEAIVAAAERFTALGAACVEQISIPDILLGPDLWMVGARLSAFQNMTGKACGHRALYMNDYTRAFGPITQKMIDEMWPSATSTLINGAYAWDAMDPTLVGKAMNLGRMVRDKVDAALSKYDLLISPTMARLPLRIDDYSPDMGVLKKMSYAGGIALNTAVYSVTGHPALSFPVGFLAPPDNPDVRLPIGMQVVGRFYDEGKILAAARAWEQAYDWKKEDWTSADSIAKDASLAAA